MKQVVLFIMFLRLATVGFAQEASPPPSPQEYKPSPGLNASSTGDDNLGGFAPSSEEGVPVESAEPSSPGKGSMGNVPDTYNIQRGDTLWDICQKLLDNPWYWPKLWSLNEYISN